MEINKSAITLVANTIGKDDIQALCDWLSQTPTPRLTKGELTIEFEKKFAEYVGTEYAVMVNSGSSAILLSLYALMQAQIMPSNNKKVVVPALSWVTDVSSVMQLGLTPILCDCNLQDLSMDLKHLEHIFKTESPSAMILVSVLGFVPNMTEVVELCDRYNVTLVEDVCESLGSSFKGTKLGAFGELSCFSTYFSHHFTTIEGGMICTNDEMLHEMIVMLRSHGWSRDLEPERKDSWRFIYDIDEFQELYTFYYPGFNLRSTDINAFIGLQQIKKLEQFNKVRIENYKKYVSLVKNNGLKLVDSSENVISNFAYPHLTLRRDELIKALKEEGIEYRPIIAGSMANKPFWFNAYGHEAKETLPNCNLIDSQGIYLPNHPLMGEQEIIRVAEVLNRF